MQLALSGIIEIVFEEDSQCPFDQEEIPQTQKKNILHTILKIYPRGFVVRLCDRHTTRAGMVLCIIFLWRRKYVCHFDVSLLV